jgi:SAM-dependent methyltransferase
MPNVFNLYPEFAPSEKLDGDTAYTAEGLYHRFSAYIDPKDIQGKTFLDVGSQFGQAGAYVLHNGAKDYVGLEIQDYFVEESRLLLTKFFADKSWNIIHSSIEKFIETNVQHFDVVFLGRVLNGITENGLEILAKLSKIADVVIIESGVPANLSYYKLKELLADSGVLTQLDASKLKELDNFAEYEHHFVEYVPGDYVNTLYSLGFLKMFFKHLGFIEDFTGYELLKKEFPSEYGFSYLAKPDLITHSVHKRFIVRFIKSGEQRPLSRVKFEASKGISNVEV